MKVYSLTMDPLLDGFVRGEVVVFGLTLAIEPACQIAQRLGHDLLGDSVGDCQVGLSRVTSTDMVYSW